jgi:5-methylcytosine-specific restriction endonuclease McrA
MKWVKGQRKKRGIKLVEIKLPKKRKHKVSKRSLSALGYEKIRQSILLRDNYKCTECDSTKRLNVHHIVAIASDGGNSPDNLITLCYVCHMGKHINDNIYKFMKSRL